MLEPFETLDDFVTCGLQTLPQGILYDRVNAAERSELFKFYKGLWRSLYEQLSLQNKDIESLSFDPYNLESSQNNTLLNNFLNDYKLYRFNIPLNTNLEKAVILSLFLRLKNARIVSEIEAIFLDYNIEVKITYPDTYAGKYEISTYDYSRYSTDDQRFVVYVTIKDLNDTQSRYDIGQYEISQYIDSNFLEIARILIKELFDIYVRVIFL